MKNLHFIGPNSNLTALLGLSPYLQAICEESWSTLNQLELLKNINANFKPFLPQQLWFEQTNRSACFGFSGYIEGRCGDKKIPLIWFFSINLV